MAGTEERTTGTDDDRRALAREVWQLPTNRGLALGVALGAALLSFLWLCQGGWGDRWDLSLPGKLLFLAPGILVAAWCGLYLLFRPRQTLADLRRDAGPTSPEAYRECGLAGLPDDADPGQLYLDQVKRAVCNLLYEDPPFWFYDGSRRPALASGFSLPRRVHGEDSPSLAHTMVGVRRLDHLQTCIEDLLRDDVHGDLIETGSYRGGCTIFMRAVLKAHRVTNRRVFVCDTFVPPSPPKPPVLLMPLIQALAAIPLRAWQRQYFLFLQRLPKQYQAFPDLQDPSDDFVEFLMWNLRNPVAFNHVENTNLEVVKSHFARYGLLDEQVVFLEGFFADTLPEAPLEQLALVRLDGDTYESTWDAITVLYPKLSPGGYLVVDDFRSFSDCQRAIEDYREQQRIRDEIRPIDKLAVFWRKT